MKFLFSIFIITSSCLFLAYKSSTSGDTRTVTITGIKPNGDDLILMENGNSADILEVLPGQTIEWIIGPNIDVRKIKGMPLKGSTNPSQALLKKRPHAKLFSKTWIGEVKESSELTNGQGEDYYIIWIDKNKHKHTCDPRIQLKSK